MMVKTKEKGNYKICAYKLNVTQATKYAEFWELGLIVKLHILQMLTWNGEQQPAMSLCMDSGTRLPGCERHLNYPNSIV